MSKVSAETSGKLSHMTENNAPDPVPIHDDWDLYPAETRALSEAINNRLLSISKLRQWVSLTDALKEDEGPDLALLQEVSQTLREMAATSPWPKRGAQAIHAYVFGRGVNYNNVDKAGVKRVLEDPHNKAVLFSVSAYETANLAKFTDGNFFVLRKKEASGYTKFTSIPISQISSVHVDPDDPSSIWYIKRSWTANGAAKELWYPLARYKNRKGSQIRKTLNNVPVSQDTVIYHHSAKKQSGWTWGVPDSLAGMVWVEAYSAYLRDNAVLVKALSKIAWKITNQTSGGATSTAAAVRDYGEGVGGVASLASGNQLQGVGVPSANVNMGNGQPLIAAVATSYGIPVITLLSSPGETGGSYGAASTLDEPTVKGMGAEQDSWALLYEEILHDLGAKEGYIEFPAIQSDPAYRQIASINTAVQLGLLWRDEGRAAVLDIADVQKLHEELPKPDGFNKWTDPTAQEQEDPLPRQGNSGSVPGGLDNDAPEHDEDEE